MTAAEIIDVAVGVFLGLSIAAAVVWLFVLILISRWWVKAIAIAAAVAWAVYRCSR